jgi:hypothetical protein
MKTVKILFLASFILVTGLSKSFASGNENLNNAYNKLNAQLKELVANVPSEKSSSFVVLTFSVNKNNEIENVQVESTNEELAKQVKRVLANEKVKVDPLFVGKKGQVSMQIENEG